MHSPKIKTCRCVSGEKLAHKYFTTFTYFQQYVCWILVACEDHWFKCLLRCLLIYLRLVEKALIVDKIGQKRSPARLARRRCYLIVNRNRNQFVRSINNFLPFKTPQFTYSSAELAFGFIRKFFGLCTHNQSLGLLLGNSQQKKK